jgi:hypothetical protein
VVNDQVIVELKAAELIKPEHFAQLVNYLKAIEKEIGLLLNFGKTPDFKSIIFTNDKKQSITEVFVPENGETGSLRKQIYCLYPSKSVKLRVLVLFLETKHG